MSIFDSIMDDFYAFFTRSSASFGSGLQPPRSCPPQQRSELNALVQRLQQCQQELEQREQSLAAKESSIAKREQAVATREDSLTEREKAAVHQERELDDKQNHLSIWQQQLAAQKDCLDKQTAALDMAADRYHRERQELEKLVPVQKDPTPRVEDEMNNIRGQLLQIKEGLLNSQKAFIQLNTTIQDSYCNGIKKLCSLYRDLSFSEQEEARLHAVQLAAILQYEFNAEPLDPYPNDMYDNTIHERVDTAHMGDQILCCRARGWKWNGIVLMHALIETTERNEYK